MPRIIERMLKEGEGRLETAISLSRLVRAEPF
jgi:hypothetical protein